MPVTPWPPSARSGRPRQTSARSACSSSSKPRTALTPDEKRVLAQAVGWGGLPGALDETLHGSADRESLRIGQQQRWLDNPHAARPAARYARPRSRRPSGLRMPGGGAVGSGAVAATRRRWRGGGGHTRPRSRGGQPSYEVDLRRVVRAPGSTWSRPGSPRLRQTSAHVSDGWATGAGRSVPFEMARSSSRRAPGGSARGSPWRFGAPRTSSRTYATAR